MVLINNRLYSQPECRQKGLVITMIQLKYVSFGQPIHIWLL